MINVLPENKANKMLFKFIYRFKNAEGNYRTHDTLAHQAEDLTGALESFQKYATPFVLQNLVYLEVMELQRDRHGGSNWVAFASSKTNSKIAELIKEV